MAKRNRTPMIPAARTQVRRYTILLLAVCSLCAAAAMGLFVKMKDYQEAVEEEYRYIQHNRVEKGFYFSKTLIEFEELAHMSVQDTPDYRTRVREKLARAYSFHTVHTSEHFDDDPLMFSDTPIEYINMWQAAQSEYDTAFDELYRLVSEQLESNSGNLESLTNLHEAELYKGFITKAKRYNDLLMQLSVMQLGSLSSRIDRMSAVNLVAVAFSGMIFLFIFVIYLLMDSVRRNLSRRIEQSEKMYRTTFQFMMNGFALHEIILDDRKNPADYRFLEVNKAFEEMTGLKNEEIRGERVKEVFPETEEKWIERYGQVALTGIQDHFTSYSEKLGKHFEVECYSPEVGKFVTIVDDVTARTKMIEDLKTAKDDAEDANEAKQIFLANMSHEMRTPMNGILGMANLILDSGTNPHQSQLLRMLKKSTESMAEIVNGILDFSIIDSDKLEVHLESLNIRDLLNSIAENFKLLAAEKGQSFHHTIEGEHGTIISDQVMLTQIITNVLLNAHKFTDYGSINLHAVISGSLTITVEDTGPGIEDEYLNRIYDTFYQIENPYTKTHRGLGIGLAVVKNLLDRLKGSIDYRRSETGGSVFTISIPIQDSRRRPVLIVEDEAISRMHFQRLLENTGLEFIVAEDGEKAIEKWSDDAFSCIFMDIGLPNIDGIEATEIIR
ncbi:MAG: ATP-binding protein, partial [Spirochaetaceae bacterium]|nr:ATP-binding protein [Spirochaetaceae bacterium]